MVIDGVRNQSRVHDDSSLAEQVAEAVVRKLDEREKINLLAEAVLLRMRELGISGQPAGTSDTTPTERATAHKGGTL